MSSLAAGGGGTVRRVRDSHLGRTIAMKVQHWGARQHRFAREARILARLQHPTIVGLYDAGTLPDGRRWFTMPEVHGKTLTSLIGEVHAASKGAWSPTPSGWSLQRLVGVLEEVAQAIAYAHEQGVVHRDLHPGNVMVGRFGQVQVVDWGIALDLDARDADESLALLAEIAADEEGDEDAATQHGTRLGTPAYMSPEQAGGQVHRHGTHTDVYALGALLDTVLTGAPPYGGGGRAWRRVLRGPPEPMAHRLRPHHPKIPSDLEALTARAMARDPAGRPTAARVAQALRDWLDGTAARSRAQARLQEADRGLAALRQAEDEAVRLEAQARRRLAELPPGAPLEDKREAWAHRSGAERLRIDAARLEAEVLGALHGALAEVPDLPEAHRRLADHYRRRAEVAESTGDAAALARNEQLLKQHDQGEHAAWLSGEGTIFLDSQPSGLPVVARPYVERDLRLVPGEPIVLGPTPLDGVSLPHGAHELQVGDEASPLILPIHVERMGSWRHRPPGGEQDAKVRPVQVADDECLVPAGWFLAGGDPEALDSHPPRRLWLDRFIIRRDPVTVREYLDFLDANVEAQGHGATQPLLPSWRPSGGAAPVYLAAHTPDGHRITELDGMPAWQDDHPVVFVTWHAAKAYAAWRSARDRMAWRLPHGLEWEKAARGTDGRRYPWGSQFDPSFCWMKDSAKTVNSQAGIASMPLDLSPYGVRGLGGNVRDWCANAYDPEVPSDGSRPPLHEPPGNRVAEFYVCRGGNWTNAATGCLSAARLAARPSHTSVLLGFRLVR